MLVLFFSAGISSVLLVGRPIPLMQTKDIVRVSLLYFFQTQETARDPHIIMIHIGQLIEAELRRQERTITWFAKKLFCDRTNVYNIFKRQSIDTETLLRISQILHHDFFVHYREEIENHIEDPLSDPQNGKL